MTKVSVLGGEPKRDLKKIKLLRGLNNDGELKESCGLKGLNNFDEIILIQKAYFEGHYDLIFAKHNDKNLSCLFLGKWNDGVI